MASGNVVFQQEMEGEVGIQKVNSNTPFNQGCFQVEEDSGANSDMVQERVLNKEDINPNEIVMGAVMGNSCLMELEDSKLSTMERSSHQVVTLSSISPRVDVDFDNSLNGRAEVSKKAPRGIGGLGRSTIWKIMKTVLRVGKGRRGD